MPDEILKTYLASSASIARAPKAESYAFCCPTPNGFSVRINEAIEYAGMTQTRLEASNLRGALRNIEREHMARDEVGEGFILLGWVKRQAESPLRAFDVYSMA